MIGHWESQTRKLNKHYQSVNSGQLDIYKGTQDNDFITVYNYAFFNLHGASYTDTGIYNTGNPIVVSPGYYTLHWNLQTDGIDCGITFIEQIARTDPTDPSTAYPVEAIFADNNTWVYGSNSQGRIGGTQAPLWNYTTGTYTETIIPGSIYTSSPSWPNNPVTFYYSASSGSVPIDFSYLNGRTEAYNGNTSNMLYIRGYIRSDSTQGVGTRTKMWGRIWLTKT